MSAKRSADEPTGTESDDRGARWARTQIEEALRGLQFGQVTIVVQDGVVVQLERTERRRFQRRPAASS